MDLTLTISGSLEEITYAVNAIRDRQERDKKILTPIITSTQPIVNSNIEVKKKYAGRAGRKIELRIDGERYKIFDSLKRAAEHMGCSSPQVCKKVDTGLLIDKTYTVHTYS